MALRKRTNSYWKKRSEQRLRHSEYLAKPYVAQIRKIYSKSRIETVKSLQKIYAAYYKDDRGFDKQALRSIVPTGEIRQFLDEMKRLGLKTDLPVNYDARVSRLRFLNAQMEAEAQKAALVEQNIDEEALRNIYVDSYYRAGFDVAKGIGSTPSTFSTLDTQTINKVMTARFEGRNFSSRIWKNSDILAKTLKDELAVAIANGQGISKTASQFKHRFNVQQSYAERLIRTETNHFHNEAELDAYKSMGFEYFQFLATLDHRTSEICQEMDNKIFKVKDGIPGENIPPLHPNCRSTIVPYFKGYETETRMYRDPKTGKNEYTYNVSYRDWALSLGRPDMNSTPSPNDRANNRAYKIVDKTKEILKQASPGIGSIRKTPNYDKVATIKLGQDEKEKAEWLLNTLGGNIQFIPAIQGTNTPDFKWNNTKLELKTVTTKSYNTLSHRIKDASKQVEREGGILLDITKSKELILDSSAFSRRIATDMLRYNIDFIIVKDGDKVYKYYARIKY